MPGEKVRIKVRHYRHGILYRLDEVAVLPQNLDFCDVLHELIEPVPGAEKPATPAPAPAGPEVVKPKAKGKVKPAAPPVDDDAGDDNL